MHMMSVEPDPVKPGEYQAPDNYQPLYSLKAYITSPTFRV